MQIMNDLIKVTEGSTVTVKLKGEISQMTVLSVSDRQINVVWLYLHKDLGWINGYRSFTRKGKIKYMKGEDSEILSLDIIERN